MKCMRLKSLLKLLLFLCTASNVCGAVVLNNENASAYLLPKIVRTILQDIAAAPIKLSPKQRAIVEYQLMHSALMHSDSSDFDQLIACKENVTSDTPDEFVRAMKACMTARDNRMYSNKTQLSSLVSFYPLPLGMYVGGQGPLFSVTAQSNPGIASISHRVLSSSDKDYINDIIQSLLKSSCMHEIYQELYRLPCTNIRSAVASILLLYWRPDLVYKMYKPFFTLDYFQEEPF